MGLVSKSRLFWDFISLLKIPCFGFLGKMHRLFINRVSYIFGPTLCICLSCKSRLHWYKVPGRVSDRGSTLVRLNESIQHAKNIEEFQFLFSKWKPERCRWYQAEQTSVYYQTGYHAMFGMGYVSLRRTRSSYSG